MAKQQTKKTVWRFRLNDPIARLTQIPLEEHTEVWLEQLKEWFYGYQTPRPLKAILWDRKVELSISIAPPGTPTDRRTASAVPRKPRKSPPLSPEKQAHIEQLQAKIDTLKQSIPPALDEATEQKYWEYLDAERFVLTLQKLAALWNDPETDESLKCRQAGPILTEIYDLLHNLELPDELMRDDTKFTVVLGKLLHFVRMIEQSAEKNQGELPAHAHALAVWVDEFTDRMIEGGNKLYGLARSMTPEENDAYTDLQIEADYSDCPDDERLKMFEKIGHTPLALPQERIEYLEKAIKLIKKTARKKRESLPCPEKELIKKHLAAISRYVQEVEEAGEKSWQLRMAEGLMDSVEVWREAAELPTLSKEEFAAWVYPEALHIQTKEDDDGTIHYELELYFRDKEDSFDGHVLYASVQDHAVTEITLMG